MNSSNIKIKNMEIKQNGKWVSINHVESTSRSQGMTYHDKIDDDELKSTYSVSFDGIFRGEPIDKIYYVFALNGKSAYMEGLKKFQKEYKIIDMHKEDFSKLRIESDMVM